MTVNGEMVVVDESRDPEAIWTDIHGVHERHAQQVRRSCTDSRRSVRRLVIARRHLGPPWGGLVYGSGVSRCLRGSGGNFEAVRMG